MSSSFYNLEEREIVAPEDFSARERLLALRGLSVPEGNGAVLGFFDDDRLVATGSLIGNIMQGIAVDQAFEGEGLAAVVVTSLLKRSMIAGVNRIFLFSKPEEGKKFEELGFSALASAVVPETGLGASLLEWGSDGIREWKRHLEVTAAGKPKGAGVVVVNCNPFTLGHRALLEFAAARSPWLYVLVVEEDRSLFPFDIRIDLVKKGTADLPNVTVLAGGPYVISSATFPTYFTRIPAGGDSARVTEVYAALDLEMFKKHIAPPLNASMRFVGTEPYCPVTSVYNRLMKEILPAEGKNLPSMEVVEMPRVERSGAPVSASRVRDLIRQKRMEEIRALVPDTTWRWLRSPEAEPVLERIRRTDTRH